jgi:hypothetical protein
MARLNFRTPQEIRHPQAGGRAELAFLSSSAGKKPHRAVAANMPDSESERWPTLSLTAAALTDLQTTERSHPWA